MREFLGLIIVFTVKFLLPIGTDESEHLHFSYLVSQNYIPYKDFYQHHLPLIWDLFSFLVKPDSFLLKIVLTRLMQSIIITISGYFFSKSFDKNQTFIFFSFCLLITLLNPIINYSDIRPELPATMLFVLSYFLLTKTHNQFTTIFLPISLALGLLFTPRFIPIYVVISLFYFVKLSFKSRLFFIIIQSISFIIFLIKYDFQDIIFFVFESTSQLKRSYESVLNFSLTSSIMNIYYLFFLIFSIITYKKSKIISILYFSSLCFILIEKHPYFNQSTVFLFIISLYIIFDNNKFDIKRIRITSIFLMLFLNITVKYLWFNMSKNHNLFINEIFVYEKQIDKCQGKLALFNFHKKYSEYSFITHPIFVEDLSYFGFIQNAILSDTHIKEIINYTDKNISEYLVDRNKSCIVDENHYLRLKNIIYE